MAKSAWFPLSSFQKTPAPGAGQKAAQRSGPGRVVRQRWGCRSSGDRCQVGSMPFILDREIWIQKDPFSKLPFRLK